MTSNGLLTKEMDMVDSWLNPKHGRLPNPKQGITVLTNSQEPEPHDAVSPSLDQEIADLLVFSVWELRQSANRAFEPLDLTTFQVAILNLIAHDPLLRSGQLAERLGVIPVLTSSMITKLEKRGLLVRVTPQEDRRGRSLNLTPAGEKARLEANALWTAVATNRYEAISRSDKEAILRVLKLIHTEPKGK